MAVDHHSGTSIMTSTQDSTTNCHFQETKMDQELLDTKTEKVSTMILPTKALELKDPIQEEMRADLKAEETTTSETMIPDQERTELQGRNHSTPTEEELADSMTILPLMKREELNNHSDQDHWDQ